MLVKDLQESSPNTLKGSFTPDLSLSKLWLANKISKLGIDFNTIYILGSWFGNMAIFLSVSGIQAKRVINVDVNTTWLNLSEKLHRKLSIPYDLQYMEKDANSLDYRQLADPSLIINTSCNDMADNGWFDNIPKGTYLALQARNNVDSTAVNSYSNLDEFKQAYPISKSIYAGVMDLTDPETDYNRFMVIGIK